MFCLTTYSLSTNEVLEFLIPDTITVTTKYLDYIGAKCRKPRVLLYMLWIFWYYPALFRVIHVMQHKVQGPFKHWLFTIWMSTTVQSMTTRLRLFQADDPSFSKNLFRIIELNSVSNPLSGIQFLRIRRGHIDAIEIPLGRCLFWILLINLNVKCLVPSNIHRGAVVQGNLSTHIHNASALDQTLGVIAEGLSEICYLQLTNINDSYRLDLLLCSKWGRLDWAFTVIQSITWKDFK